MAEIWPLLGLAAFLVLIVMVGNTWARARQARGQAENAAVGDGGSPGTHDGFHNGSDFGNGGGDAAG